VPTNFTKTVCALWAMATTKRQLLPSILNTARRFFRILAPPSTASPLPNS
jgi:hypothetical protein